MTDRTDTAVRIRRARPEDAPAVASFTADTWGDQYDDYLPDVFEEWARQDGDTHATLVATLGADAAIEAGVDPETIVERATDTSREEDREAVVGCIQGVLLSEWEAWAQGIRVNPDVRGRQIGGQLSDAVLEWAREEGASVCRNMVFSWNEAGLGQSRAAGFDPSTEFRFARPEPATAAESTSAVNGDSIGTGPEFRVAGGDPALDAPEPDPDASWAFWTASTARDHLRGLVIDPSESWAVSELTRQRLADATAADRLLTVTDGEGTAGFAIRTRTVDRGAEGEPATTVVYGVGVWRDAPAAAALFEAVSRDAAAVGADRTRVLIPERVEAISDAAFARVPIADEPDFVMSADLTGDQIA